MCNWMMTLKTSVIIWTVPVHHGGHGCYHNTRYSTCTQKCWHYQLTAVIHVQKTYQETCTSDMLSCTTFSCTSS